MIQLLAGALTTLLAFFALLSSWIHCIDEDKSRNFFKRLRPAGWFMLFAIPLATVALLYVQSLSQQEQDEQATILSNATETIRNTTETTSKELRSARDDLKSQAEALEKQSKKVEAALLNLELIQLQTSGLLDQSIRQSEANVEIASMATTFQIQSIAIQRLRIINATLFGNVDMTLATIAQSAETERSPTNTPDEHRKAIVLRFDNLNIPAVYDSFIKRWEAVPVSPERYAHVTKLRNAILAQVDELRQKPVDLMGLRVAIHGLRGNLSQFHSFAEEIDLESFSVKLEAGLEEAKKALAKSALPAKPVPVIPVKP